MPELNAPGPKFERNQWALALSGGGYKAAAYHLGALVRMNEAGVLPKLRRISSVSGGSIIAGWLAINWKDLNWNDSRAINFHERVVLPFAEFLHTVTIDVGAIAGFLFKNPGAALSEAYDKRLYGGRTLQDLPDDGPAPRFVFNATNMRLNSLWRFSRKYAADYRVGEIPFPKFDLARVVAASSAFPPFFCPFKMDLKGSGIRPFDDADRFCAPFNEVAELGDGGIYDNMGLETLWKRYGVLLMCNAGDPIDEDRPTPSLWHKVLLRTVSMMHRQAENNRISELMFRRGIGHFDLAYMPARPAKTPFPRPSAFALSAADEAAANAEKVRLRAMPSANLNRLVRHGYARADAAMRSYLGVFDPAAGPPVVDA